MAKGRWKHRLGWGIASLLVIGILPAATWRIWLLQAVRLAAGVRGVEIASVRWERKDALEFINLNYARAGLVARAKTIVILTPPAWKRALRRGETNQNYFTVDGWRIILKPQTNAVAASTNLIAERIQKFNMMAHRFEKQCPRALIQNGTLQTAEGEFNFGVIDWKNGELSGNFTWPQLNDPADFKLKVVDASKLQLIVKQIALDVGARVTMETLADGGRLVGYARWKTNRIDFDATFAEGDENPRSVLVDSKWLTIPGRLVGMPDVDTLNARTRLVITNGRFDFAVGAPPSVESGTQAGDESH